MSSFRFGSHLPVLMQAVRKTDGAILELGSGLYSTVYLHWACFHAKRKLVTIESKKRYYREIRNLRCDWHTVTFVDHWDNADLNSDWSVVLVDHSPGWRRPIDARRVINADYVIIHDTEEAHAHEYHYDEMWGAFKYRFDYKPGTNNTPETSVLSNKHDLTGFMDD